MINELLEANYLNAIGDDDVKLGYVMNAATDLRDEITKRPAQIVSLTLIALDPDTDPLDALIVATEDKLKKYWQTYSNKFRKERPVQLLRAVIIEALSMAAASNINFAGAIWYTGSAYLPHKNAKGEQDLIADFLKDLGNKVESTVVRQWSLTADGKQLKQLLEDSVTHTNGNAPAFDGGLAGAVGSLWSTDTNTFDAKKASSVASAVHSDIGTAVEAAIDGLNKPLTSLSKLIATEILKNKLLWWRQAKYSETLRSGFRNCDELLVGPVMAREMHLMVPDLHPASVEYFLSENVAELVSADRKTSILELADSTAKFLNTANLADADPFLPNGAAEGRNSLVGLINECRSAGKVTKADFKRNLNIDPLGEVTFPDFAVWCFKDMQAFRLLTNARKRK